MLKKDPNERLNIREVAINEWITKGGSEELKVDYKPINVEGLEHQKSITKVEKKVSSDQE